MKTAFQYLTNFCSSYAFPCTSVPFYTEGPSSNQRSSSSDSTDGAIGRIPSGLVALNRRMNQRYKKQQELLNNKTQNEAQENTGAPSSDSSCESDEELDCPEYPSSIHNTACATEQINDKRSDIESEPEQDSRPNTGNDKIPLLSEQS